MRTSMFATRVMLAIAALLTNSFASNNVDIERALYDKIDKALVSKLDLKKPFSSSCFKACKALQVIFDKSKVIMRRQTSEHDSPTQNYSSSRRPGLDPSCVFKPSMADDVSIFVLISRRTQCPFAGNSSRGDTQFLGTSSIRNVISLSFENMKGITLSSDKMTASIGPGNNWYDVYSELEKFKTTVIGAKLSIVDVGSAILGGGISFFSNMYGWACDNVESFEVVIACGSIITASPTSYQDLYWALRGGGNNFGIVTKFNLFAYPQGEIQYNRFELNETYFPDVIRAFATVGAHAAEDPKAQQLLGFGYANDSKIVTGQLSYQQTVKLPQIFSEYRNIPILSDMPDIYGVQSNLTALAGAGFANGLRQTYSTATFKLDPDFAEVIVKVFYREIQALKDLPKVTVRMTLQVITIPQIRQMARMGGNPLGLNCTDGPLLLFLSYPQWSDAADDSRILDVNQKILKCLEFEARKAKRYNEYIYMNYASQYQDVIASYGQKNKRKLKKIAKKYDSENVFQSLQLGNFKLNGAPLRSSP